MQFLAMLLCLVATAARADLLLLNNIDASSTVTGVATASLGQSFTMPTQAPAYSISQITASILDTTKPLQAVLFSAEFSGSVASLSSTSPGYVGASDLGTNAWNFNDVPVQGGVSYWCYFLPPPDTQIIFELSDTNPYPGGIFYAQTESGTYTGFPIGDLGFTVSGTAIPEPSAIALWGGLIALVGATAFRRCGRRTAISLSDRTAA